MASLSVGGTTYNWMFGCEKFEVVRYFAGEYFRNGSDFCYVLPRFEIRALQISARKLRTRLFAQLFICSTGPSVTCIYILKRVSPVANTMFADVGGNDFSYPIV